MKKIPILLHTDIGSDIDDNWALALLLKQRQLDLKLILTDTDNTFYRASLCAKMLGAVPGTETVEILPGLMEYPEIVDLRLKGWIRDFSLREYRGSFEKRDGVGRFIEWVRASREENLTLVSIGPVPSLAEALREAPEIAEKINFVGMFGSLHRNYEGEGEPVAEYNVQRAIAEFQKVLAAPWRSRVITPLDTCGVVKLGGDHYRRLMESGDRVIRELLEAYRIWRQALNLPEKVTESSILYDTVAVHLASSREFLEMQTIWIRVGDDGIMVEDRERGVPVEVALRWRDLDGYLTFLTDQLLQSEA